MAQATIMSSFGSRTTPVSGAVLRSTSADIWPRIPHMDRAGRTENRGNAGEIAASFFHPSRPSGIGYLIQRKSLI